ncbi:peroxiredoxin [Planctomycetota bacterium]
MCTKLSTHIGILLCLSVPLLAVDIGETAPIFNANDHNGNLWQGTKHIGQGQYLIIYFYPAAMTGGCTKQACAYRNDTAILKELGITVAGVSADPVNNLKAFQQTEGLNFSLLSDVNGTIAKLFGVPLRKGGSIERSVEGKETTLIRPYTTARWTFIVDKQGKVIYKKTDVKAANDSQAAIAFIKGL